MQRELDRAIKYQKSFAGSTTFRVSLKSLPPWEIFHDILSSVDFFSESTFSKISFKNTIKVANSLDPDQARPDMGPNCLQRLSADDTKS